MIPDALIDALASLVQGGTGSIFIIAAVLMRMSAIAFLAPGFGERTIPMRARLMAVFALTAVVAPSQSAAAPPDFARSISFIAAEAMNGLIIGMSVRTVVFALQAAGAIIAQHMTLTQLFGVSALDDRESVLSTILTMATLAAAAAGGLHVEIAALANRTYEIFPIGAWPPGGDVAAWASAAAASVLSLAFAFSLPFVLLGLAYSLALAAASRAMPQLSAVFIGAPASLFAGLVLFAATSLVIVSGAERRLGDAVAAAPWGER